MSRCRWLSVVALSTCVTPVLAQTFNEPTFYVWGWQRPSNAVVGNYLTNMVQVDGYGYASGITPDVTPDPAAAAQVAANKIIQRVHTLHDLDPNEVCITIFSFGRDYADCDGEGISRKIYDLRYFTELDRLPGLNDYGLATDPDTFPVNGDDPLQDGHVQFNDGASNRSYRHPFLINAGDPGVALTPPMQAISPMRNWMTGFVSEYLAIQQVNNNDSNPLNDLPSPKRFYMDTEAHITSTDGRNSVYMLWWLAQRQQYWSDRPVPGTAPELPLFPNGLPLKELYERMQVQYSLPPFINLGGMVNGAFVAPLNPNFPADNQINRRYMLWWYDVCQKVQTQVMKFCVYDVVQGAWPGVHCGNYEEADIDYGIAAGNTGWYANWEHPYYADGQRGTRTIPSQTLARCFFPGIRQGSQMWGVGEASQNKLFAGLRQHRAAPAIGQSGFIMNSPPLYQLKHGVFDATYTTGEGANCQIVAGAGFNTSENAGVFQQPNYYRPWVSGGCGGTTSALGPPCETRVETSLRLARHMAESIIESNGGKQELLFVPWVQQATTQVQNLCGEFGELKLVERQDLESMLMMLRGKNIPEAIFWTGYDSNSANSTQAREAWDTSQRVVEAVYAPRIEGFIGVSGTQPAGQNMDPSRLEFTLNVDGMPSVVQLDSVLEGPQRNVTALIVTFGGLPTEPLERAFVAIECSSTVSSTKGRVFAFNHGDGGGWAALNHPEEALSDVYNFWTPLAQGVHQARVLCDLSPQPGQEFVDQDGRMTLLLVHENLFGPFKSRYDLVQVLPRSVPCATCVPNVPCPTCAAPLPIEKSDFNMDGVKGAEDLQLFMEKWGDASILSDLNADGVIDLDDLAIFIADYMNGS